MSLSGTDPQQTSIGAAMASAQENRQQQQQQQNEQQQSQPRRGDVSWRSLGKLVRTPMGRSPQSEILTRITKALEQVYADNVDQEYKIGLLPIDWSQELRLPMSVLVVTAVNTRTPDAGVAFHTLLLEGSVDRFPPRFESFNGENVEVMRVASEGNDTRLAEIVIEYLRRNYNGKQLFGADACVVPRDFNLSDERAVYNLATNAAIAVTHELEQNRPNFQDVSLAAVARDDSLVVRVSFPRETINNSVGLPVRADLTVDLTAVPANQSQSQQGLERQALLAQATGYVDIVWAREPNQNGFFGQPQMGQAGFYQQPGQPPQTQSYFARLVLTSMESIYVSTLPAQLLALVNASAVRENNVFMNALLPSGLSGEVNLHDIGAINMETGIVPNPAGGLPERVGVENGNDLSRLMALAFHPGLAISMDVEDTGPSSWYNGVFPAAAGFGRPESVAAANEAIYNAANYLTNGAFSKYFQPGTPICSSEGNLIHLGYFTDSQGNKRDLREIDYLYVLNRTITTDPNVIRAWSESYNNDALPVAKRLSDRKRIINAMTGNTAEFTGFARRVTFTTMFMDALIKGCLDCGLDIRTIMPYVDQGTQARAGAGFLQNALMQSNASGLYNRGFSTYQGNQGYQYQRQGGLSARWG